jgi:hypothetical protein
MVLLFDGLQTCLFGKAYQSPRELPGAAPPGAKSITEQLPESRRVGNEVNLDDRNATDRGRNSPREEAHMDSLRLALHHSLATAAACCRCAADQRQWDRIAGKAYCPECEEALILGLVTPLRERTESKPCAICCRTGTVPYLTFPLHSLTAVEMDLCPEHLRGLLGRRLRPYAFEQLQRRLRKLGLDVEQIFLLHDAFYDPLGRALQPAGEME